MSLMQFRCLASEWKLARCATECARSELEVIPVFVFVRGDEGKVLTCLDAATQLPL